MSPPSPPRRPPQIPPVPVARVQMQTPRVLETFEPRNCDERETAAEQRRIANESKHDLDGALVSATRIWSSIAENVMHRMDELESRVMVRLDNQDAELSAARLERLARSENDAAREARHRVRLAYVKVFVPLLAALITVAGAAVASYHGAPTPAPVIDHQHH